MCALSAIPLALMMTMYSLFGQAGPDPSLVVTVVDPSGVEVEAVVTLTDSNGSQTSKENEKGGVKFFGLGIEPVGIRVGKARCNRVTVNDVPLRWGETIHVKIVYNVYDCLLDLPRPSACQIVIRAVDATGKAVSRPNIVVGAPYQSREMGDELGRLLVHAPFNSTLMAEVSAPQMKNAAVQVICDPSRPRVDSFVRLDTEGK